MKICLIAAMSKNRVIGIQNKLPWHLPEDMKFFREKTRGFPVVMGRKTFDSLQGKPLPKRPNFIITRNKSFSAPEGVGVYHSVEEAFQDLKYKYDSEKNMEIFFIGGEEIYRQSLPFTDRIYLTVIEKEYNGDAFFPEFSLDQFQESSCTWSEDSGLKYSFRVYDRTVKFS